MSEVRTGEDETTSVDVPNERSPQGLSGLEGTPLQAHIHKGKAGKAGAVVVPLGQTYKAKRCTTATPKVVRAILRRPGAYYVNVHDEAYPGGAVRGQLERLAGNDES